MTKSKNLDTGTSPLQRTIAKAGYRVDEQEAEAIIKEAERAEPKVKALALVGGLLQKDQFSRGKKPFPEHHAKPRTRHSAEFAPKARSALQIYWGTADPKAKGDLKLLMEDAQATVEAFSKLGNKKNPHLLPNTPDISDLVSIPLMPVGLSKEWTAHIDQERQTLFFQEDDQNRREMWFGPIPLQSLTDVDRVARRISPSKVADFLGTSRNKAFLDVTHVRAHKDGNFIATLEAYISQPIAIGGAGGVVHNRPGKRKHVTREAIVNRSGDILGPYQE